MSPQTVGNHRASLSKLDSDPTRTYQDRHGNTNTMNTENIGKRPEPVYDSATDGPSWDDIEERFPQENGGHDCPPSCPKGPNPVPRPAYATDSATSRFRSMIRTTTPQHSQPEPSCHSRKLT